MNIENWKELAVWANQTPRPQPPELTPGLQAINEQRLLKYREQLVGWLVGKAEAIQYGLPND